MARESSMQRSPDAIKGSEKMRGETRLVVYVESKDDVIVYKKFINFEYIEFTDAGGWEKVKELVEGADTGDKRIGIIDADFTHITQKTRTGSERIFLTDTHDLETLVVSLAEKKIIDFELVSEDVIIDAKNISKQIGILRFINNEPEKDRFGLRFRNDDKKLPYYDKKSVLYQNKVFESVVHFNTECCSFIAKGFAKKKEIESEFKVLLKTDWEDFQIINGHDLLPILNYLVNKNMKYYNFDEETEKNFLMELASKIDKAEFEATVLYQAVSTYYFQIFP
ncbi:TPA: DUF4435 domain-containing protein [Streptococcus suis]